MISVGERALLIQQLVALDRGGTSLSRAVVACRDVATSPATKRALSTVADRLGAGDGIGDAFAAGGLLPEDARAIVAAGEDAGASIEALDRAGRLLSLRDRLHRAMRSVLAYPLALCLGAGALALAGAFWLHPQFRELPTMQPGYSMQLEVGESGFPYYLVVLGGFLLVVGGYGLFRIWRSGPTVAPVRLPFAGDRVRRGALADVLSTVAAAMRQGLAIDRGLALAAATVRGRRLRETFATAAEAAVETGSLSAALSRGRCLRGEELDEIKLAEEGDDPDRLDALARALTTRLEADVDRALRVAGPVMTVAVGVATYMIIYYSSRGTLWDAGSWVGDWI